MSCTLGAFRIICVDAAEVEAVPAGSVSSVTLLLFGCTQAAFLGCLCIQALNGIVPVSD